MKNKGFTRHLFRPKKGAGFTLIELLVAAGIFSIVVITISGIFVAAISTQRNILSARKVLGQVSYATEFMSRALRMAVKDYGEGCISFGSNYENHAVFGEQGIRFRNILQNNGECQEFYLDNGKIKFKRDALSAVPDIFDLTSAGIEVTELRFLLNGETQYDDSQPLVTIYLEAKAGNSPPAQVQTSISQRNLDVSY